MRQTTVNKTRPLFTLSLEMTRLVNETRLLLVPGVNSDIYSTHSHTHRRFGYYIFTVPASSCISGVFQVFNSHSNTLRY